MEPDRKHSDIPVYAVIVAGGTGKRFGTIIPKQFALLNGKPVLQRTLEQFRKLLPHDHIITVINGDWQEDWMQMCRERNFLPGPITSGGSTRWESVRNGVYSIPEKEEKTIVLVHDAARPLVTARIIEEIIDAIEKGNDGAIPVIKISDSLRTIEGDTSKPVDRNLLRAVQTPQGFPLGILRKAFGQKYSPEFTDEATMVQKAGFTRIVLTEGQKRNLKITDPEDLVIARFYLDKDERP